jgi:GNAT superfamily N-acetyltransferase
MTTKMLTMRPVVPEDEPFLRALRAEHDSERLHLQDLGPEMETVKKVILASQFEGHAKHFKDANWDRSDCLIEVDGEPVGRFIVMQNGEEIRLADIVVAGEHRGKGIGRAVIEGTQGECIQSKRPLRLHVEKFNPALQFYQQMGFRLLEDRETHFFMEWTPPDLLGKTMYFPGQGS